MSIEQKKVLTLPKLKDIPYLVHGFGTKNWEESDFKSKPELARFKRLYLKQVHSDIVHIIKTIPRKVLEGDAMVTARPGILLVIRTADCLPVFLVDVTRNVIAAVHCGWRGTKKYVLRKTVDTMHVGFGCVPESLLAAMGPCIAAGCYEVGEDVFSAFGRSGLPEDVFQRHPLQEGKYLLDLDKANRAQLRDLGVREENIFSPVLCTHCDDRLLSYRRDRKTKGRLMNFIGLSLRT